MASTKEMPTVSTAQEKGGDATFLCFAAFKGAVSCAVSIHTCTTIVSLGVVACPKLIHTYATTVYLNSYVLIPEKW